MVKTLSDPIIGGNSLIFSVESLAKMRKLVASTGI
jgi:hypothetical protein